MNKNKIIELTNQKIGFYNYQLEEKNRKQKRKNTIYISLFCIGILCGFITVNAISNNSIINLLDRIIDVNGEKKVAKEYINTDITFYEYDNDGNYIGENEGKCIQYNDNILCFPNDCDTPSYICPKDNDKIEFLFDENNHFMGFKINDYEFLTSD